MSAEYDDLPEAVKRKGRTFAEVNVAWLRGPRTAAGVVSPDDSEQTARAMFAAVIGTQLFARSRSNIALYDSLINGYCAVGLLQA